MNVNISVRKPNSGSRIQNTEHAALDFISKVRNSISRRTTKSGIPFRGGPLSPELFRGGPVWNSLEADRYFEGLKEVDRVISKVRNSNSKRTGPELPLAAGHDIQRSGLSFAADHKGLDLPIRSGPGPDLRLSDTVHGFLEAS
ncbi:hypothetical protein RCL_jg28214.t1 [Rhizophagus clarus]|uniref:Uncharacterized protein n=1 Tax=Rhizophagus clarus TaxID=94130 RepID=A0A8H3LU63_9GLOM|nr:hypothetical protein RCL_jg28214.t1 [Rhizophagus clarus]